MRFLLPHRVRSFSSLFVFVLGLLWLVPLWSRSALASHASAVEGRDEGDQCWWDGFGQAGLDGSARAFAAQGGDLIVGGSFLHAGDMPARHIARLKGTCSCWDTLGAGVNGRINALTLYHGDLVAAGGFSTAGGVSASNIARWDGSSWWPLGDGTNGLVLALTVYDGKLIAGGDFTIAGGGSTKHIASWDGSSWGPLAYGLDGGGVRALTVYDGGLAAGGDFTYAVVNMDPPVVVQLNHVGRWNGGGWGPFGNGLNGPVYSLAVLQGNLVAGGSFTIPLGGPDSSSTQNLGRWDGAHWTLIGPAIDHGLPGGVNGIVTALTLYGDSLVVGGAFTEASDEEANNICWYGSNFLTHGTFGSGTDGEVDALLPFDGYAEPGDLAVGGVFEAAGGKPSYRIARWMGLTSGVSEHPLPTYSSSRVWPNPMGAATQISYSLKTDGRVRLLVLDSAGRLIDTLVDAAQSRGDHSVMWSGINRAGLRVGPGVYFGRVEAGAEVKNLKIVVAGTR